MISLYKINGVINSSSMELVGLSTDEKPIKEIEGHGLGNGSLFLEMDTGTYYIYDSENSQWWEI